MLIISIAVIVVIPILSQIFRVLIEKNIGADDTVTVIPGLFNLTNISNRGVAFGFFQNGTVFFAVTTSVLIVVFSVFLAKEYKNSKLFSIAAALIIGGGLGNLYERIFLGYVVDYLSLSFFPPICNFADYCITAGTVCLMVYILFFSDLLEKEKDKAEDETDTEDEQT